MPSLRGRPPSGHACPCPHRPGQPRAEALDLRAVRPPRPVTNRAASGTGRCGAAPAPRPVRLDHVAGRDLARVAGARRVDPPRGRAATAPRDHRRDARRQDPRGLHGGPGRGGARGARRRVPGGVPDRADHARGATGGGAGRRAPAAEPRHLGSAGHGEGRGGAAADVHPRRRAAHHAAQRQRQPRPARGGRRAAGGAVQRPTPTPRRARRSATSSARWSRPVPPWRTSSARGCT